MADALATEVTRSTVENHVRRFFSGHHVDLLRWSVDPVKAVLPNLRVARIGPGSRTKLWTFASLGAWEAGADSSPKFEWMILGERDDPRLVEILVMVAFYGVSHSLGIGHTFSVGEPWMPGSSCDHILISLPYPFGPTLEMCPIGPTSAVQFLWLLPITSPEMAFLRENGADAIEQLETRLETRGAEYANPNRPHLSSSVLGPNPSLNADVPRAGFASAAGRRLANFVRRQGELLWQMNCGVESKRH